jgi:hypothetical protein
MEWLAMKQWSPYAVGVAIGLLNCAAFLLCDRPIGCSAAYARTSGMIERLFRGAKAALKPYYRKFPPVVDGEWMLVLGIIMGAFLSAKLSGQFAGVWVPAKWAQAFGAAPLVRLIGAVVGGVFVGVGARWAGGCTSGHGISGTMQLAVSSWIAVMCFFAGGIATAMAIFKVFAT